MSPDTDNDGHDDGKEIKKGTDPCDPDSYPSAFWLPFLLVLLAVLANTGSVGYLIYKKYYIPLVSPPPKPTAVPGAARPAPGRAAVTRPAARPHVPRRHVPVHRRPSGPAMSKDLFDKEIQKRAAERERILSAFGERKVTKKPSKVMEEIARKPVEVRHVRVTRPARTEERPARPAEKAPPAEDYVSRLSGVVSKDYFDKIEGLSREEADYFGKLATITKKKKVPLEEDHVSKLANISKKVAEDRTKKKELETAFKRSGMDELDSFLTSGKRVDTFIKEAAPGKEEEDSFAALSRISEGKEGIEALSDLSRPKRKEVIGALAELTSKKAQETALSKMDTLADAGSKKEIISAFRKMSREKHVDKNVFNILLSYLLKSGKISKNDVSSILFDLEEQGVLDKKDVSEVFFNLGIKR
jgi:hypothetical protein